jgi:hypothetical protein
MTDNYININYDVYFKLNRTYSALKYIVNKSNITIDDINIIYLLLEAIDDIIPSDIINQPLAPIASNYLILSSNVKHLVDEMLTLLTNNQNRLINITRLTWIHESFISYVPEIENHISGNYVDQQETSNHIQQQQPEPEPRPLSPISVVSTAYDDDETPLMPALSIRDLTSDFEQESILIPTISEKMVAYENYSSQSDCSICMENAYEKDKYIYVTRCDHTYCKTCFETWKHTCTSNYRITTCAMCRSNINHITIYH